MDTLKYTGKGTFKVYKSELFLQFIDLVMNEIMASPNLSDKSTTTKSPKLFDQSEKLSDFVLMVSRLN